MSEKDVQMLARKLESLEKAINEKNDSQDLIHADLAANFQELNDSFELFSKGLKPLIDVTRGFSALLAILTPIAKLIGTVTIILALCATFIRYTIFK